MHLSANHLLLIISDKSTNQSVFHHIISGLATAARIAYYSYIYAIVKKEHYKTITSYIRAAEFVGGFFAYGLGQFLVSFNYASYLLLNQVILFFKLKMLF